MHLVRRRVAHVLAVAMVVAAAVAGMRGGVAAAAGPGAGAPRPVYVPASGEAADPGVVRDGHEYYAFLTGGPARVARASAPQGPWVALPDALARLGPWASGAGAALAPGVTRTSAGWIPYYAAQARGLAGQRCIGTAVSADVAGPYVPAGTPLVCPILGGEDPATDRPVPSAGVIDRLPFQAGDGERYLLYKTQQSPATIRMFPLSADGVHGRGELSRELVRHADSIEAPVVVQRGDEYVLFASANWYDQCAYATVWRRSTDLWSFADRPEHVLLEQAGTGLCGPGGADVVTGPGGPSALFLHAWVCPPGTTPCRYTGVVTHPDRRRVLYAAILTWSPGGATPSVPAFLPPAG